MTSDPFAIEFEMQGKRLRALVTGINGSLQTTIAYWMAIAEEVRRRKPTKLLVVDHMEGEPPPPEQLQAFVAAMAGQGFDDLRVAYVEMHHEQIPQVEVAEIFARESGYVVRVFGDEAAAEVWLRYGER